MKKVSETENEVVLRISEDEVYEILSALAYKVAVTEISHEADPQAQRTGSELSTLAFGSDEGWRKCLEITEQAIRLIGLTAGRRDQN